MLIVFSPSSTDCTFFCVGARSTDHLPDNNSSSAQSVRTSSFLQHHNPAAQQQQQWAHLARVDGRTAAIKVDLSEISIDHLTTPRPHHHHLSSCCFFCIAVCDPTLPLLQLCSAQCANSSSRQGTMRMWKIRAIRSALTSVRCCCHRHWPMHVPRMRPAFFARYRSSPDRYVCLLEYNKSISFVQHIGRAVQASCTAAFVQNILTVVSG